MKSVRVTSLLLVLVVLAACAAPVSNISMPPSAATSTPAPTAMPEAGFAKGVVLAAGHYQLLMLYSPLWTSCRELAPVVNGLMNHYTDRVHFVRVNIHDPKFFDLETELGFSTTPEFYLIDPRGKVERKWDDSIDLKELEQTIKALPVIS